MSYSLYFITGAPGSGKSTTLEAFLRLRSDYIAFDIDWLTDVSSDLAQKSIYTDPSIWQPYSALWFEILHAICKNGRTPIFFTPNDPQDIERFGQPAWCREIKWLLLDCDDKTRRVRLSQRQDWTELMVTEATTDAQALREVISTHLDTSVLTPDQVATKILAWLQQEKL